MQVVHTLHYIHLTNKKTLQSGSDNVIHSRTAYTRPDLQPEKCGVANFTQTPYVSHHLVRVLSGGQLHHHVCSHKLYAIHPSVLLHGQSDMQCSVTFSSVPNQGLSCLQAQTGCPHIHIQVPQLECLSFAACTLVLLNTHSIASSE